MDDQEKIYYALSPTFFCPKGIEMNIQMTSYATKIPTMKYINVYKKRGLRNKSSTKSYSQLQCAILPHYSPDYYVQVVTISYKPVDLTNSNMIHLFKKYSFLKIPLN